MAVALARRGVPVVVAEAAPFAGGQARSFRYDGFTFDLGLHAFVTRRAAIRRFVREVLGPDYAELTPRAATLLEGGRLVADGSRWSVTRDSRAFYDLFPANAGEGWNCMLISKPPRIIYPRRGGFARLCERLVAELRRRGGRLLLGAPVSPAEFRWDGPRLVSARVGGRRLAVSGCYWSAGGRLLAGATEPPGPLRRLLLFHFLVRGPARERFHWVRLDSRAGPFLPGLAYYPAAFAEANAPSGCHGVGAVLAISEPERAPRAERLLRRFLLEDPATLLPMTRAYLAESGLLPAGSVLSERVESLPMPFTRLGRRGGHPYAGAKNLWDSDDWLLDDARESGVALQMAAALAAVETVAA